MKLIKNKDMADKSTNFDAIRTSNTNCANASDKEKCFLRNLTLFKAGWGRNPPGPVLFRPKHHEGLQKVGVMGYVNLS